MSCRYYGLLPRLVRGAALLCIMLSPATSPAQSDLDSAASRQRALVEEIERIRLANGPLSAELIEPLSALALIYEEDGDEAPAVATTENVLQVMRATYGLYSLEQAPLIARLIDSAATGGNHAAAWNLEQELLALAIRNPDDLRSVPILHAVADKRIELLEHYIAGEHPPQIELGCYRAGNGFSRSCRAGSRRITASAILTEAQTNYLRAIDILTNHQLYSSDELMELEMDIVRSNYRHGKYLTGTAGCRLAHESLIRIYDYDNLNAASLARRVASFVQSADYELVCGWTVSALKSYRAALALLEREGAPQSLVDQFFSPETPIRLPTFVESALDVRDTGTSATYIDVAFSVTKFGASQKIEILDGKKNPGAARVLGAIRRGRFRPIVQDGEFVDSPRFMVRYFLEDVRPVQ
jgi:hypothetical protein